MLILNATIVIRIFRIHGKQNDYRYQCVQEYFQNKFNTRFNRVVSFAQPSEVNNVAFHSNLQYFHEADILDSFWVCILVDVDGNPRQFAIVVRDSNAAVPIDKIIIIFLKISTKQLSIKEPWL